MKVIHCRFYNPLISESKDAIQDRTSLLVWFLSVLKWNQLGYDTILYADKVTIDRFEELGLKKLYKKVHQLENLEINEEVFWACSKIKAAQQFMLDYPNEEFIMSDLDFVPLKKHSDFITNKNNLLVFYHEYYQMYKSIEDIGLNKDEIPAYYTGLVNPVNTCLLYVPISRLNLYKDYLEFADSFMKAKRDINEPDISNALMTFIEQRLFTEYMVFNGVEFDFMSKPDKSVFNVNGLHSGVYKNIERTDYWKWNIWYLKMLKDEFGKIYEEIINLDLYSDIKSIIDNGNGMYKNNLGIYSEIKDFNWDTLEYPRAFEDIYDPLWQ